MNKVLNKKSHPIAYAQNETVFYAEMLKLPITVISQSNV